LLQEVLQQLMFKLLGMLRVKWFAICLVLLISSCYKDAEIEQPISFSKPANFPEPHYTFQNNELTQQGFLLGRKLFYDPILSKDSSISCGSCHQQFAAFAHSGHKTSHGIHGLFGTRNTPSIFNMAWSKNFMWDGGIIHIEKMPVAPINNPVEMDETMLNVVLKLNRSKEYRTRFKEVFGKNEIDDQQLLRAFAQFMGAMISANSKYDKYVRGESGGKLNTDEQAGLKLFQQKCAACHSTDLFTDYSFRNNGLDQNFSSDNGRAHITQLAEDEGKFRVPSLRNVEVTAPYMHDGRFWSLEKVVAHYATSVVKSSTLDPLLIQPNDKLGIPLSDKEQQQIVAFLKTLTDQEFLNDKRFSE
jgi:cytochrome c peroxidase